jgi:histidyl-tRNA synthetase
MGQVKVAAVKGTRDLLPAEARRFAAIEQVTREVFSSYGYGEIRTPILESTDLFVRSVGEATDIVHKEMFTFLDRGGRSVTLRPENTAGVVRAVVENRLAEQPMPLRLFYSGPQFRYERPQKGRYREFRQIGAELFGAPGPEADAEVLLLLFDFLSVLGFSNLLFSLNAVPSGEGRPRFADAIRNHASRFEADFSEDDRRRLRENPLRLFDSKDPRMAGALEDAPRAVEFLEPDSRLHHERVLRLLADAGIPFAENPRLVRGLDYYTRTVFEVTSPDLGAQDAILGGGRYDNLVADLGGPALPAVGFAIGEDRLVDIVPRRFERSGRRLRVVPIETGQAGYALAVAAELRKAYASVDVDLSGRGLKKGLAAAADLGFDAAAVVGEDEMKGRTVTLKDLKSREQRTIDLASAAKTEAAR